MRRGWSNAVLLTAALVAATARQGRAQTDCEDGTVNAGAGAVTPVLFINDRSDVAAVAIGDPVTIALDVAPAGPDPARYVLFVWPGCRWNPRTLTAGVDTLGCTVNRTPLQAPPGSLPIFCVNGGLPAAVCGGVAQKPGPARAPWVLRRNAGFDHVIDLTLQAIIADNGADNDKGYSVTNAVILHVGNRAGLDVPDATFTDDNCDGIDGDVERAVFVAVTGDDFNAGTREAPFRTIQHGIDRAVALADKDHVYVSEGTYAEAIVLSDGVSVWGGYSAANDWERAASHAVVIDVPDIITLNQVGVEANGLVSPTVLGDVEVRTNFAPRSHVTQYALHGSGSPGLAIERCRLFAARGSAGRNGSDGSNGSNGENGGTGGQGDCQGPITGAGGSPGNNSGVALRRGGRGGEGGAEGANAGEDGEDGGGGATGGNGGAGGPEGGNGSNGSIGSAGTAGANGAAGSASGSISATYWAAGNGANGVDGTHGHGGGAGGGGGGQGGPFVNDGSGNGGGGGGEGGGAGAHGNLGTGGGGSIGCFLHDSTGAEIRDSLIESATGGPGGGGGNGGSGGTGGNGGAGASLCPDEIGEGGDGARGGNGGRGGHGGGGAGGISCSILLANTTLAAEVGNSLVFASGGTGGPSLGNNGATGASGTILIYP